MKRAVLLLVVSLAPVPVSADSGSKDVVVLELFTSQGCSSCPSADRYLTELGKKADSENLIPLAFHVDYWDYIGWEDPFASPANSKRQRAYARARKDGRVYTPQLVINGKSHVVGSNYSAVQREIKNARKSSAKGTVKLVLAEGGDHVLIRAKLESSGEGPVDVVFAIVESGLETSVGAGENNGSRLYDNHVVRRIERVGTISGEYKGRSKVSLDSKWKRSNAAVVVYLQDRTSKEIYGAARLLLE